MPRPKASRVKTVQDVANAMVFSRYDMTHTDSLAMAIATGKRCGIYWLIFDNGEEYVGQAVDVVSRFGNHRRHQEGVITDVHFAPVPESDLDVAEQHWVTVREQAGARLRNKLLVNRPLGVETVVVQIADGASVALPWDRNSRGRIPDDLPAAEPDAKLALLVSNEAWPHVREGLHTLVDQCMSSPHLTAGRLWSATAIPSTNRSRGFGRLCTSSAGRIEVAWVQENGWTSLNLASPDDQGFARVCEAVDGAGLVGPGCDVEDSDYGSNAVLTLTFAVEDLPTIIGLELVQDLLYELITREQRRGFCLQGHWHNATLGAAILAG